jgi:hypothetical protein
MCFARANNTGNEDLASLAHARSFTSGTWANHNRKIEAAIEWADIAGSVYTGWQPEGNIAAAVKPGLTIGSQPLLTYNAYWVVQTFIGYGNYWGGPSGTDTNSLNVQLIVGDLSPIPVSASIHSGQLVLSWPSGLGAVSGFSLLTSPVLGHGAHWSVVSTAPAPVGSLYEVTLPAGPGPGFYKLVNLQRQWFFTIGGNL